MAPIIVTTTLAGNIAVDGGVGFWLTACCGAAVTGVCEGSVCKGCFREVDARLGFCWMWDDTAALSTLMDHVEGLIPELDSEWAFKLVHGAALAVVAASAA